ncbi:MAG: sensor domain-containing diguanylate cyclase [Candidatus Velthaea sp.]
MSTVATQPFTVGDLLHRRASATNRIAAFALVAVFALLTLQALRFGTIKGPEAHAFVPICATVWSAAELLTAYLFFSQFVVNGFRAFLVLGAAYATSGLLTIPYVAYFPGVFIAAKVSVPVEQISVTLWVTWHLIFPLIVGAYHMVDGTFKARNINVRANRVTLFWMLLAVLANTVSIAWATIVFRAQLPLLVVHGHFTPLFLIVLAPLVFALNAAAAVTIVVVSRAPSSLQVWLAVALATSALDGFLNAFAASRYTLSWYLGKSETLATASVVLLILLGGISALYQRLDTLAMRDALTGLRNRRTFDEYVAWAFNLRARTGGGMAFLMIDVDMFKAYNDRYGHGEGDDCLRRVATAIRAAVLRPGDIVARYGGEEFAAFLPDGTAAGAHDVAERVRHCVEVLCIEHALSSVAPFVTVSVGVAYASDARTVTPDTLYALADKALYVAKKTRNSTVLSEFVRGPVAVPFVPYTKIA